MWIRLKVAGNGEQVYSDCALYWGNSQHLQRWHISDHWPQIKSDVDITFTHRPKYLQFRLEYNWLHWEKISLELCLFPELSSVRATSDTISLQKHLLDIVMLKSMATFHWQIKGHQYFCNIRCYAVLRQKILTLSQSWTLRVNGPLTYTEIKARK